MYSSVEKPQGVPSPLFSADPQEPGPQVNLGYWIFACIAAGAVGLAAAAFTFSISRHSENTFDVPLIIAAGTIGSSWLGLLQALTLSTTFPQISVARYLCTTIATAVFTWCAGVVVSFYVSNADFFTQMSLPSVIVTALIVGALAGLILGAVQWWSVRQVAYGGARWLMGSTIGWAGAVAIIVLGTNAAPKELNILGFTAYGGVIGLIAGAALGLGTIDGVMHLRAFDPIWRRRRR